MERKSMWQAGKECDEPKIEGRKPCVFSMYYKDKEDFLHCSMCLRDWPTVPLEGEWDEKEFVLRAPSMN
jgi:hypothetical protein